MNWDRLLSTDRLRCGRPTDSDPRSPFERDADRIIFSGPFRRLSRKTQVHPLAANDHVHNRLTHSLETSHVGRTLGKALHSRIKHDLPGHVTASDLGSLLQAACLAHDIGNPPFGHAGEEALAHWFAVKTGRFDGLSKEELTDLCVFDGNAQGFRIITQLENFLFAGGLRLTYATLGTFLKYPRVPTEGGGKFSVFLSEKPILDEVADNVGMPPATTGYARHPLAYLVEAADDICYSVLDLEDAVELGILTFKQVSDVLLAPLAVEDRSKLEGELAPLRMFRVNFARIRGSVFRFLEEAALEGFMKAYGRIMAGQPAEDVFTELGKDDPRSKLIQDAKGLGRSVIYQDPRKVEVELGAFATLDTLLRDFFEAARQCASHSAGGARPDWRSRLVIQLMGDHAPRADNAPPPGRWSEYLCYRRALDYISGMTDNYATYLAKQMQGMAFTGLQRP
jgi:dGTPase